MKTQIQMINKVRSIQAIKPSCGLFAAMVLSGLVSPVVAETFTKADNTTALNLASTYTANSGTPGVGDTIQIDNTLTAVRTSGIGANLSISGINQTSDAVFAFTVGPTTGATLTIGGGGVTVASTTSGANISFANTLALGANQTWSIASGRSILVSGTNFSDGNHALAVNGTGTFDLRRSNTFGANVTIGTSTVSVNTIGGTVVLGGSNTMDALNVYNGRLQVATIGNYGEASNAGDGGTASTIGLGTATNVDSAGVFEYTGATASTNRTFRLDQGTPGSGIEVSTAGQTLTISGALSAHVTPTAAVNWNFGGAGNLTLNGVIAVGNTTFLLGIKKKDGGTLTLGGNNLFRGGVTLDAGTLAISASERIHDDNNLILNGGTFALGGFTETLGTLDLNANAGINLGSGGQAIFGNSSLVDWNLASTLSISGTFLTGSSIRFGLDNTGLTTGQLGRISIAGFENIGLNNSGFLTADVSQIPEPSTYAALVGLGALFLAAFRRRGAV